MEQSLERRLLLLEPDKNLPEPVEPRVRHLHNPPAGPLPGGKLPPLLAARPHMRSVAVTAHDCPRLLAVVARIGAEILAHLPPRPHHPGGEDILDLRHVMPVGSGHDYRQRETIPVDQDVPLCSFFFPCRSGWGPRPRWRAEPFPGSRQCSASSTQSPPSHHIRPGPSARA